MTILRSLSYRVPHDAEGSECARARTLCSAAIPLAVIAGPLLDVGGGVLVKTGTEYSARGTVYRTLSLPVAQVHTAVLETLHPAVPATFETPAHPRSPRGK